MPSVVPTGPDAKARATRDERANCRDRARDRVLDEVEQLLDAFLCESALVRELDDRRLAVQPLRELAAGAHQTPHLLGHVDRQTDRPALVGKRTRDRLSDPPGGVCRELEA